MSNRTSVAFVVGALVLGFSATVPAHSSDAILHTNYLTFSGPVALPGVTLGAGTYVFERAEATNPDIIVVRNRERSQVYYLGFTDRVDRPKNLGDRPVTLGEPTRGAPPRIMAWFPLGENRGHQFVYGPR